MAIDLGALAQALLDLAVSLIVDPPARQYVSPGRPPHDFGDGCDEQIVVWLPGFGPRRPFPGDQSERVKCAVQHGVGLCVELVRCVPVPDEQGSAPSAADLDLAGKQVAEDLQNIVLGIADAVMDDSFPGEGCSLVSLERGEVDEPQGGVVAVRLCLTVAVG